jgi:diketogulonate reductase-like aldo/keto reductase
MNDGHQLPQLGFGVFEVPPGDTVDTVIHALKVGYRSIDTAAMYHNESEVAEAIARSGVPRDEVFVTTKVWNGDHGREQTRRALEQSLRRLDGDYVDLYLIHWPVPSQDRYVETWQTLSELKDEGSARSIGVSNFQIDHLERIIEETGVVPAINQVELHPRLQQPELRQFHERHRILTEAWSPLGRGAALEDRTIRDVASRHERTPAQIILRWHIQLGNVVIPRSVNPSRIEENFQIFDFELTDEDMQAIEGVDEAERIGPDPRTFAVT